MKNLTVLINPPQKDPPPDYYGPPYGLSLIGAVLQMNKKPVKAYDLDQQAFSIREIVQKERPAYIGITIQSCTRGPVYELIRAVRQTDRSVTIILGGPFASQYYGLLLKNFPVDYIVIHEGEMTLNELIDCLENGNDPRQVKGLAFLSGGKVVFTGEREQIKDLDRLPYPAFSLFGHFDRKINSLKEKRTGPILGKPCVHFTNSLMLLSSRGCLFYCNFCPMSKVFVNKIRYHSPEYFADMTEYFHKEYGIANFIFGDNNFTMDLNRASGICREISRRKLRISWSCMTRSDRVTRGLLREMARAGCYEIFYGVETGSAEVQRRIGKNLDLALSKKVFQWTEDAGIRCSLMLMAGNLGETKKSVRETLVYLKDTKPSSVMVKMTRVYPGTRIHDLFERKGLLPRNYYLTDEFEPPLFTLEHSARELTEFGKMLGPRTTRIEINNSCNNNCVLCPLDRTGGKKSMEKIRDELVLASRRGEAVLLTGGEPFLRPDFFRILDFAAQIPIHQIRCASNGRLFFYRSLAEKVKKSGLREMEIPFFGLSGLHDRMTRVKGSFFQTVRGLQNLKKHAPALKLRIKIFITALNPGDLEPLTVFLSRLGADEFQFLFFRDRHEPGGRNRPGLPSLKAVLPRIKKISGFLAANMKEFGLKGFPLCVPGGLKERIAEYSRIFDETVTYGSRIVNDRQERMKRKKKAPLCRTCADGGLCEGIWTPYLKEHGTKEFKPV